MPEKNTGKVLSARVKPDIAKKFEAVRRALRMTDAQLLRYAIDIMFKAERESLDAREAELLRNIQDLREALTS